MTEAARRDTTESALVILARAGDELAFEALVRRRQGGVRSLLRRLSGDPALGDDLAQDTFVQVWRSLGRLQDVGAFGGWLRQVAVNTWLQHLRRKAVQTDPLEAENEPPGASPALDAKIDLDAVLTRLGPSERLCVVLAYAEGMTHTEIAAATGMPIGTVKSRITRGAARLRSWLEPASVK